MVAQMNLAAPGRGMLVGALGALAVALGPAAESGADGSDVVKSYCSPTGDFCIAVTNVRHRAKLELQTFSFDSSSACLKGPGANSCTDEIKMDANSDGVYSSRI